MKILRTIYTFYGMAVFGILFAIALPFFFIPIIFPKQFRLTGIINRWWARLLYTLIGIPFSVRYEEKLDPRKQYIFCPNHFSYLDIPSAGLNTHNSIFVGKSEMETVPVFGYMYRKLHITVDRSKLKSRYSTMLKSLRAIDEGKSLIIFPEGGILTKNEPELASFKDGAFRASIEKQIPIVPVTIPFNWIILSQHEFLLTWKPMKVIFHKPIDPAGYTMQDIDRYKNDVRIVIEAELKRQLNNENRPRVTG